MTNSIIQAFKSLNVSSIDTSSDHETIFDVSYQYLSKIKEFNDLKAFKNCLVSLINLDRYYKAFELIEKIPSNELRNDLALEIGYVYYKIGKSDELLELCNNIHLDNEVLKSGLQHIIAQNYYKIGEYEKALNLYYELIDNNKFDNNLDLIINERSIISQLNFLHKKALASKFEIKGENNYDLLFNEALIELSNNNVGKSLNLLHDAEKLCLEQNAGLPEQDLLLELLPIKVTISYIYQLKNEEEKSLKILIEINLDAINDSIIKLIIKNNYYSLYMKEENFNLIDRDLNFQQSLHKLLQKLTKFQYQIITKSNLLLKYSTNSLGSSYLNNKFINKYISDFEGDFVPIVYKVLIKLDIKFDDLNNEIKYKSIGKQIFKFINNNFGYSNEIIIASLLLTFINEKSNNFDQSLIILEKLTELDFKNEKLSPGLVGTLINIYERLNLTKKLNSLFEKVVGRILSTNVEVIGNDLNYYNFIKLIGFKLFIQSNELSIKLFGVLSNINSSDKLISSILSNSSDKLLPINELSSKKSIDELLSTKVESLVPSKPSLITKQRSQISKVTKKSRKPIFSANKIIKPASELTLDRERWLPLKLRSYYKPTKKDKKRGSSHQGAVESTPTASSLPTTNTTTNTNASNSLKNKKKKKKGKK